MNLESLTEATIKTATPEISSPETSNAETSSPETSVRVQTKNSERFEIREGIKTSDKLETSGEVKTSSEAKPRANEVSWRVWLDQTREIVGFELKKIFFNRRSFLIYLLALAPPLLFGVSALLIKVNPPRGTDFNQIGQAPIVFAAVYQALILRTVVFFGCAWLFMNLFRGETVDRSLHYYFLSPVRREVLLVAKFIAGLIASILFFVFTTLASMLLLYSTRTANVLSEYFLHGAGAQQAFVYAGITCLACLGYGAVFVVVGLVFRNPIIPALAIYGWEFINFLLPPVLKRVSVIFYLQSLEPLKLSEGPFAYLAEPSSAFVSIFGLLIFACVMLFIAAWRITRMEINYGNE